MTNAQSGAMSPYQPSLRGSIYQMQQSAARMAGTARGAVNNAVGKAGAAFSSASKFMPVAGPVLATVGAGLEAKSRLDRGEDLQRAATGAATGLTGSIAGGAQGAALGSFLGPVGTVVGGIAGAAIGGFGAGFVTDRVTDAVRGNDGKGTDAVLQDLNTQIQQAQAQGNPARAGQLMQEAIKFQNSRQPAGSQGANNYQLAQQNGVQQSDATEFGNLNSRYRMGKMISEDTFNSDLNQNSRSFEQQFGQGRRMNDEQIRVNEIERLRTAQTARMQNASKTQQELAGSIPGQMTQRMMALQGIYGSAGGGIR